MEPLGRTNPLLVSYCASIKWRTETLWIHFWWYIIPQRFSSYSILILCEHLSSAAALKNSGHTFKHLNWCWWCDRALSPRHMSMGVSDTLSVCVGVGVVGLVVGCLTGSSCTVTNSSDLRVCLICSHLLMVTDPVGLWLNTAQKTKVPSLRYRTQDCFCSVLCYLLITFVPGHRHQPTQPGRGSNV